MTLTVGVGLLCSGMLLFAWAFRTYRRPGAPRWTQNDTIATTISLAITILLSFGAGWLGEFASNWQKELAGLTRTTEILTIVALVAAILLSLGLLRFKRAVEGASAVPPTPFPTPRPRLDDGRPAPHGPKPVRQRRAA